MLGLGQMYMSITKSKSYNNDVVHVIIIVMLESWLICRLPMQGQGRKEETEKKNKLFAEPGRQR